MQLWTLIVNDHWHRLSSMKVAFINPWTMFNPILNIIENHSMTVFMWFMLTAFCKQTNSITWNYSILTISVYHHLYNHATQIWLLEVFCGSRSFSNLPDPRMFQAKCFARICSQAWTKEENKWVHIIALPTDVTWKVFLSCVNHLVVV